MMNIYPLSYDCIRHNMPMFPMDERRGLLQNINAWPDKNLDAIMGVGAMLLIIKAPSNYTVKATYMLTRGKWPSIAKLTEIR